jgi:AraC family transcriptional regulator of adaptative response / DNA-3-methyladenine glycosylase II
MIDSVSRLASAAAERIGAGALNARPVSSLAKDLHVSERHVRRALRREVGVSPVELAQTHRLLMAKRLLADTSLDMTRVAFASGFQSLRRFNAAVREQYGMPPTALRRATSRVRPVEGIATAGGPNGDALELALAYRPPFDWDAVLRFLARNATAGMEIVDGRRYGRTVRAGGRAGIVFAEDAPRRREVRIGVSESLVPALMPLLAGLRRLFDLDTEPTVIDEHLRATDLADRVNAHGGIRVPGAIDGFEAALLTLLHDAQDGAALAARVVRDLGDPIEAPVGGLNRVSPDAQHIVDGGENRLAALGVRPELAGVITSIARAVLDGLLRLDPDDDVGETLRLLTGVHGISEHAATMIVMRALYWPDAFPADDPVLVREACAGTPHCLVERAEAWRPWRAYAAMHLWMGCGSRRIRAVSV